MSDLDEGRDVRAAFGTLLVGEPTSPWSAADDVARGRALQRRRRTRAGAGIGLAAAAVMVFGVFGPWRPKPAAVAPPASSSVELEQQVTDVLADLGWDTDGVARVSNEPGSPEVRAWTVHRTEGNTDLTSKLVLRTWDERSWEAAVNPTSVIAGCTSDALCTPVSSSPADCASADCWLTSHATTRAAYVDQPEGSFVSYLYNEGLKLAVEVVVEPLVCITCSARPLPPFLTEQETTQVLDVVQGALEGTPSPSPSPTKPSSSDDAVTRLLQGYGFRANGETVPDGIGGGTSRVYQVDVDLTADNPRTALLTLTAYPAAGVPIGAPGIEIEGTVLAGCTSTTCTPIEPITVPCASDSCFQYWTATTTSAYPGLVTGTRAMFRSAGGDGAEAVVGPASCAACTADEPAPTAFLTLEQTQEVLDAFIRSVASTAGETTACTNSEVKIVPAVGSSGGATGEQSVAIEVYARNPSISCTVDGFPSATLMVGSDPAASLTYTQGVYGFPDVARGVAVIVDESHAAVFVVAKDRCDAGIAGRSDGVAVALPGSSEPVVVELPSTLAPELCAGSAADAGHRVWVSYFTPRAGGVS